jgi:hypothetical protein
MGLRQMLAGLGIISDGNSIRIPGLVNNIGRGKTFFVDGTNGTTTGNGTSPLTALSTLAAAKAKMTTGNNDKLHLIAATTAVHIPTSITWDLNLSHICGEGSFGRMNQRARIDQTAAAAAMFIVSGYGNTFSNLYFMHGTASATNLKGVYLTGARNTFLNCHILAQDATALDEALYTLVAINNSEQYFKGCTFGGDAVGWSAGSMIQLGVSGDGGPPRVIFEDCLFIMDADAAGGYFISGLAGMGNGVGVFLNCQFINIGTTLTLGIDGTGLNNYQLYFDSRCSFAGVTDVCAAAYESKIWFGTAGAYSGADENNLLALHYDHTA